MVTGRYHFVLCRILERHFALKSDRLRVSVLDCRIFTFFHHTGLHYHNRRAQHLKLLLPYYFPCISFFYQTIHFSMFCVILVVDNLMIKSFIENMTYYLTKNLGVLLQI